MALSRFLSGSTLPWWTGRESELILSVLTKDEKRWRLDTTRQVLEGSASTGSSGDWHPECAHLGPWPGSGQPFFFFFLSAVSLDVARSRQEPCLSTCPSVQEAPQREQWDVDSAAAPSNLVKEQLGALFFVMATCLVGGALPVLAEWS